MAKDKADLGQDRISLMVVEDNEYMLDILGNSLKRLGFSRIQKFKNGKDAVEYLKLTAKGYGAAVEPIDIVVSDLVMSPVSGLHLLQWLRDDKAPPSRFMPFIMLSGVLGDERFIRQVLINLLSNAVKFSPANGKIEVTASYAQGDSLNVSVADNGPGIEPAILRRLGEPFLQGNPAISQSGQGTGLGLSICKRYMDLLGGKLVIDSTLDRGTIATLRFTNTSLSDTR